MSMIRKRAGGPACTLRSLKSESIGMFCCVTISMIMLWGPAMTPQMGGAFETVDTDLLIHQMRLAYVVMAAVAYLLFRALLPPLTVKNGMRKASMCIASVASLPVPLLSLAVIDTPLLLGALFAGWTCSGLSVTWVYIMWAQNIRIQKSNSSIVTATLKFPVAGCLFLVASLGPHALGSALAIAVVMLSCILWLLSEHTVRSDLFCANTDETEETSMRNPLRAALASNLTFHVFVFFESLMLGLVGSLGTSEQFMPYAVIYVGVTNIAVGVVMYFVYKHCEFNPSALACGAFLALTVVGLFLISLDFLPLSIACLAVIFAATTFFDIANTAFFVKEQPRLQKLHTTVDYFMSESKIDGRLGSILGWLFGMALLFLLPASQQDSALFLLAAAIAVSGLLTLSRSVTGTAGTAPAKSQMPSSGPKPADAAVRQDGAEATQGELAHLWSAHYQAALGDRGLTEREREIFVLLAEGRNRAYIHNRLFISPSTVRNHTYSIYRKLAIHDQQALIDIAHDARKE